MVWESWYWKLRLKGLIAEIETLADQPDASDLDISNLEIAVFTGFFLTRKLIEAETKISFKTENQRVLCQTSGKKPDAPLVDVMNRFDTHKLYDLDGFVKSHISLKKVCNIFVHSVFLWMVYDVEEYSEGEGVVVGVHLTSSYDKQKSIYWIKTSEILRVFNSVVADSLDKLDMDRDPETREMKVRKA
ncbi:hypothetical protein A9995_03030 [Erythrobacter sp. QSSC1-22B]|uniref:hypothetical protein n=1 Tax=Erythrobacter sp. QSSC1-22B TaxID=1860125 RepID=UPI000804F895|nr:hypothetical protein [Erythrobacter sp. QSSC1-22B]OBX20686.1 hypothetical protein A9995_03030 [Erythrobacter sp. QSSC1-22B]